ncbi:MAG: hypothetical protein AAF957_07605 [Planctomycetota bacterium]
MRAAAAVLLVAVSAALSGCRTTTVSTRNLDAVLSSTNSFRYQGPTTTLWRDTSSNVLGLIRRIFRAEREEEPIRPIRNPTKTALENIARLSDSGQGRATWRQNEQVRLLARYARYAPSQLCRERALRELVPHGQRLAIKDPYFPDDSAANAAELIEALRGLVETLRGVVSAGGRVNETSRADFDAAVEVLETTAVDIQGGSRLLQALGPFIKGNLLPKELREDLEQLSLDVQGTMIREAIWAGSRDPSEHARASAFQVGMEIFGERFMTEALLALAPRNDLPAPMLREYTTFDIPTVPPSMSRVHVAVAGAYEEKGLPLEAQRQTMKGLELRGTLVFTMLRIAASELTYTDEARHAAMRALTTISGGELETLRPEEWDDWWRAVLPTLDAEIEAIRSTPEALQQTP